MKEHQEHEHQQKEESAPPQPQKQDGNDHDNHTENCPTTKDKPKILVANTPMDYDKIKIFGTRVKVDSMNKVSEIE